MTVDPPLPGSHPEHPIHRGEFGPSALLAAQMTCYFDALPEDASGLVAAYREVIALMGPRLTWVRTDSGRDSTALRPKDLEALPTWFSGKGRRRDEYEIVAGEGVAVGDTGRCGFAFAVERDSLPGTQGYFQFHLPAEALSGADAAERFAALADRVWNAFAWTRGTAGFGVASDPGELDPERDEAIRGFVMRHEGVECHDLLTESELPAARIKSVNWLTYLGAGAAAAVGLKAGAASDAAASGDDAARTQVRVEPMAHGLRLRAGDRPLLGDRNRREDVEAYREADRLVRAIRVAELAPLPGFEEEGEATVWLARFERGAGT